MIHDKVLNFHDGIICYHEPFHDKIKRQKSLELSMGFVTFKQYESYFNTLNTELC